MVNKGLLGGVWALALVYAVMSDQMLSKLPDVPCQVSEDPRSGFGLASVVYIVVLPTILGPVIVTVLHVLLTLAGCFVTHWPVAAEQRTEEVRNLCSLLLLTVVFLSTYTTSMVACELYQLPGPRTSLFNFVLVSTFSSYSVSCWPR